MTEMSGLTLVTALLDLGRGDAECMGADNTRSPEAYWGWLLELLSLPFKIVLFVDEPTRLGVLKCLHDASIGDELLGRVEFRSLSTADLESDFEYFSDVTRLQSSAAWVRRASWLKDSPQARLPHYNPLVMSKMRLLARVAAKAQSPQEHFFWCDAGLTRTCPNMGSAGAWGTFLEQRLDRFLVVSFPYESGQEIHGFARPGMAQLCRTDHVSFVVRGGFFGGPAEAVHDVAEHYEGLLAEAFAGGDMGTEENVLTALAYRYPEKLARYELAGDGLIWPLFSALNERRVPLVVADRISGNAPAPVASVRGSTASARLPTRLDVAILTFNSTEQLQLLIDSWEGEFASVERVTVIDNSTCRETAAANLSLCLERGFNHIAADNVGVCGGRQRAAEEFAESDASHLLYLEDDMLKSSSPGYCRSGFPTTVDALVQRSLAAAVEGELELLKLCYSELFGTHERQWAWCNMSPSRQRQLHPALPAPHPPVEDSQLPRTRVEAISSLRGLPVARGDAHYSNWPHLISQAGNRHLFLEPTWETPYEQDWMVRAYELQLCGQLPSGVLLASPINHCREHYYAAAERVEHR
ncbi:MAG: WlaTC/HtrL family glycosyltransferase [Congregibacter sp.]